MLKKKFYFVQKFSFFNLQITFRLSKKKISLHPNVYDVDVMFNNIANGAWKISRNQKT